MRLQQQSRRMQRRQRGVEFNPHPMTRKYRNPINLRAMPFNGDSFFSNADHFAPSAIAHGRTNCPYQQANFQSGEGQHRPKTLKCEKGRYRQRRPAQQA
jgi:hypothetical protein